MPSFDIDISFNADYETLDEIKEKLEELNNFEVNISITSDSTEIDDTREKIEELNEMEVETTITVDSEDIDDALSKIEEINGTEVDTKVNVDSSDVDEMNDKIEQSNQSIGGISTALTGLAGVIGLDAMIGKADRINTSWNQLKLTFAGTGISMDTLKAKSNELSSATGRSGSQVRDYFNQMGIAGIKNVNLLSTSFKNMAGRAYQTGSSIESMEGSVQKMVMGGNAGAKMLSKLGISSAELAKAMGTTEEESAKMFKSLSTTERLEVLNKAMGDGTKANEMYKNSYAGLKEQAGIAIGGLMNTLGQTMLPIVIPIITRVTQAIKTLTGVFKSLPSSVTGVIGVIGGGLFIFTALIGVLGTLGKVISIVGGGLKSFVTGIQTARRVVDALRNAESISAGIKQAYAIVMGQETVAQGANTTAKEVNTVATGTNTAVEETSMGVKAVDEGVNTGLALSEWAVLAPLLLIVGAVIAVVAVLWYLYNNNEQVRQSIDGLVAGLQSFIGYVIGAVQGALQGFISWLQELYVWLSGVGAQVNGALEQSINYVVGIIETIFGVLNQIWLMVVTWLNMLINMTPQQILQLVFGVISVLNPFPAMILGVISRILPIFIQSATSWISNTVSRARQLVNQVTGAVSALTGRISSAISGVAGALARPFVQAYQVVKPYIDKFEQGVAWAKQLLGMGDAGFEDFGYSGQDFGLDLSNTSISDYGFSDEQFSVSYVVDNSDINSKINDTLNEIDTVFENYFNQDNTINMSDNVNDNLSSLSNENNNITNINNTFNINGIIEEEASQYIVNSIENYTRKQNLIRGR